MTSPQSLLYAAASEVTIERVRALVRQVGPEAPTIEYKAQMAETIARGVAALANTYGGLLLVGVSDDRTVRGVREKTIESVAEHCAAKIEPPWVPEIIPVPLGQGSDLYVLVLRVVPGRHPRPLLVDGVAYVRHQNTSHPADWQRLRDLFTEAAAARQDDVWNLQAPDVRQAAAGEGDVDFVLRSGFNITVAPDAMWRPLAEGTVTALIDGLNGSPLHHVLERMHLAEPAAGDINQFHREGHNRARTVRLEWSGQLKGWTIGQRGPVGASVIVEVPGEYGRSAMHMQVETDVVVRYSAVAKLLASYKPQRAGQLEERQMPPGDLGALIDAVLATLTSRAVVTPLADLSGIDPLALPQPRVMHMVSARPATQVLDTAALTPIPKAGISRGAHLLADPALDLADDSERAEQIRRWLIQIALDAGLTGMEQFLSRRAADNP